MEIFRMSRFRKETTAPEETGAVREKSGNGWLRNHWCALSLCIIVIVAFALRTVFAYGISADGNFALSGGSSAQYHLHVIESILNGSYSMTDSAVNYPNGGLNVFPPLFDFIGAGIATVLTGMGMSTTEAASAAIGALNPIIGALTCIPVYLVAKEMFDKRVGVVAALVFAFLALPISTTVFSSGTEYGLAAFLVAFMSWFVVKMVKAADAEDVSKKAVLVNAVIAGIFMALAALTWNGFRFLVVILIVAMVLQIVVDRFRGRDFQTVLFGYIATLLVGTLIPAAYYMPAGLWEAVYSGPLLMMVIAVVLSLVFMAIRSKPWVVTVPALVIVFVVIAAVLAVAAPDLYNDLIWGNSIYSSSIMDELASSYVSMSNVSSYYGWLTMWLPICYALYSTYVYFRKDHSATRLFITIWMFGMFFAVWTSYANAAVVGTVFAVGSAIIIVRVLEAANLRDWWTSMRTAGFSGFFRKMIKPFPFASVVIVALLIVVPNVSFAVDAGISNNSDADYYFSGNTQYTIKTGDSYPIGDLWDSMEDQPKDGALVSWIDYANDAVAQGGFDTVVDTVGGGTSAVSHMYLSEGAGGSVAAMMLRIILSNDVNDFASCFDGNTDVYEKIRGFIEDPSTAVDDITSNPDTYGNVRSDITDENAVYLASINAIVSGMNTVEIMNAYDAVCDAAGQKISYVMLDPSMLPLQYGDGDTFSTIAYFGDYAVDRYGAATQFYSYNTYYGYTVYTDAIYDTFLWKAMIGPSAAEAGFTGNNASYNYLVALSSSDGSEGSAKGIPGYGLAGYEVVYWQVQYNPDSDAIVTDDGWEYMDGWEAIQKQKEEGGAINYLSSIVMLHYVGTPDDAQVYEGGVTYQGTGVIGATVSVYQYSDVYGQYVLYSETTTRDGAYEAMVPSGDYRIEISIGDVVVQSFTSDNLVQTYDIPAASVDGSVMVGDNVYGAEEMLLKLEGDAADYEIRTTDGSITIDSILPGTYDYTLYSETGDSMGTGTVTVYPGNNTGFQVSPTTRTITVTVNDVNGDPVPDGALVIATNQTTMAQFQAEVEDGQAVITVVSGKYNLSVGQGYASMYTNTSNATSGNRTATITAYDAHTVTVSGAQSDVLTVSAGSFNTVTYVDDETGEVRFDVPYSIATDQMHYTIYGVSGEHVYHALYQTSGDASIWDDTVSVTGSNSSVVSGQLMDGDSGDEGTVQFISGSGEYFSVATDSEGNFTALLPEGTYTIAANNGSNKVYIGSTTVGSSDSDMGELDLVDGRRIGYTLRYDNGQSGSNPYLPFVMGVITFNYNGQDYELYGMTNTSGVVNFYIPDDVDSTISLNNAEGTLDNAAFHCESLTRDVDAGTSNNTNPLTIDLYDSSDEDQENYVKAIPYTPEFDMTVYHYDDSDTAIELKAGVERPLLPGTYTVEVDGSTGHYYNGSLDLYAGSTQFYGFDAIEDVVTVNVTNAETDIVSVSTTDGSYHRFDGGYYLEVGYEYYFTSTNTNDDGHGNIAYGYLDLTDVTDGTYTIDMTASQHRMQVTGYVGTVADGTITVSYEYRGMTVKHDFDVTNGAYTLTLPADVSSVDVSVEVNATIDSEDVYYYATGEFTGLALVETDGTVTAQVRNISVLTGDAPVDEDAEQPGFTSEITGAVFSNGNVSIDVSITNNTDRDMTYLITGGSDLSLNSAFSLNVPANSTASTTVYGTYDVNRVAPGSSGMTLTVADINGTDTQTMDVDMGGDTSAPIDVEVFKAGDDDRAASNRVSAYQYMYAVTVVNNNVYTHDVTINVPNVPSGWYVTIVDESGRTIAENGATFQAPGLQTSVYYVKLMLLEPGQDSTAVPSITANVIVGSHSETLSLSAGSIDVSTDDMTASGGDALDERSGLPVGIWFLVAVILLMLVAIFWLASKRGVFSRR